MSGQILIGTSSWTDPTLIKDGHFYPPEAKTAEQRLRFYASRFPLVEVDSTYYALPAERTAELWNAIRDLETTQESLRKSREETVKRLAIAAEFRDDETGRHVQRMSRYCALLAREMGADSERAETIRLASQMHDVGKLGIPDYVLRKPGPLTPAESPGFGQCQRVA